MTMTGTRSWLGLAAAAGLLALASCVASGPEADLFVDDARADGWWEGGSGPADRSGVDSEHIDRWTDESLDIYFVTYMDIEDRIADEVARAEREIRVAMYNVTSERLLELLLARQREGLDVQLFWDARQMEQDYNTLDDVYLERGLDIVPVLNRASSYATLHDKLAVIDGEVVMMGSANWGTSALNLNNECVLVMRSAALAGVVDAELDELETGVHGRRPGDAASRVQLYFSPEDRLDRVVRQEIERARERIDVAVFSFRLDDLADALIAAHGRGVEVTVITDRKQLVDTDVDETLRAAGIPVVEALNEASPYTAMHHKFMVVDGRTTVVGSFNWTYTAARYNYEDLAVIRDDPEVAAAFEGEIGRLWGRYAPEQPNPVAARRTVTVEAVYDGTAWGDGVVLVGSLPELGSWDPRRGLALSGEAWPTWRGSVELRAGASFEYKLVVLRANGSADWERGPNRAAVLPTDPSEPATELRHDFRR